MIYFNIQYLYLFTSRREVPLFFCALTDKLFIVEIQWPSHRTNDSQIRPQGPNTSSS